MLLHLFSRPFAARSLRNLFFMKLQATVHVRLRDCQKWKILHVENSKMAKLRSLVLKKGFHESLNFSLKQ